MKQKKYLLSLTLIFVSPLLAFASNATAPHADRINVAAAENGGIASASSTADNYTPDAVIDGDRKGINLTTGGGWRDETPGAFPDWVQVEFNGVMSVDEVSVFTQQDTWWSPLEPSPTLAFFNNGVTSFEVQRWDGEKWITIPGVLITNSNLVWRRFTFPKVDTDRIRVLIHAAKIPNSTIVEVEAFGVPAVPPDPNPTPAPTPVPGSVEADLAARDIFFDQDNNVGFGTHTPIFNDDGTTGAFVGRFVAIDGRLTGAAAYLGLGGTVPTPGDRVGVLNFYNWAMGGADHRTAGIYSFNGPQLGTGTLEIATAPNFIGPVRRMQIAHTGEIGINHLASTGNQLTVMGKSTASTTKALS
ncbi:MAG TPA: discoidin domain-containing protein, partial [Pyrinomonadaceae bacterium]